MTLEHTATGPRLDVLLMPGDLHAALVADARAGLSGPVKSLPPKYFYDERGSRLFEQITALPEYYQTRTEAAILADHAEQIARLAGAEVLLELGSGSSTKTRLLLDAMSAAGQLNSYVPVDVSPTALRDAMTGLCTDYPGLALHGVVADFDRHLPDLPAPGRRMFAFLGGTIGNYPPGRRHTFLTSLAATMTPGETLLVGVDLVKDPTRLINAYDDDAGVTAAFNRNLIRVLNDQLDGNLDPDMFAHVALWDPEQEWIQMRLRALEPVAGYLAAIDLPVTFEQGEAMLTEISAKFTRARLESDLSAAGLRPRGWWTDPAGDFALSLAAR